MPAAASLGPTDSPAPGDPLELALELGASLDPKEVVARILERSLELLHSDRATLSRLSSDEVIIEAVAGLPADITWIGRHYPRHTLAGQPPVARAIHEARPVFGGRLNVADAEPEFRDALTVVRHTASVPLLHAGELIGLLVLSRFTDRPFTERDEEAALRLGRAAGLALRNALVFEASRAAAQRLRSMVEASEDIAAQVEIPGVIGRLLRHMTLVAGADEASLATPRGDELFIEASTSGSAVGERFPIAPQTRAAIRTGQPVQLTLADYVALFPEVRDPVERYRRFLVVPLAVAGETFGVCALGRKRDVGFSEEEIAGARNFATLASLLIRNIRARQQAQAADAARSEFVNAAVHELRSPLAVIRGYLNMLTEGDIRLAAADERQMLATLEQKARELSDKIDEMQLAARVEFGVLESSPETFDAIEAVSAAVERALPRAEMRGATVSFTQSEPVAVAGDRRLLGIILDNLINNALTHNPAVPSVEVSVSAEAGRAEIRVRDNGPGIPAELRDRIFERFIRGGGHVHEGMGLGLYLSRHMANLMGGSLGIESSDPSGSVFRLELPLPA
jgi:signal transduction histidine kinase